MTPLERADKVRDLSDDEWFYEGLSDLLPPGSLILTPDEAEKVRAAVGRSRSARMRWSNKDRKWSPVDGIDEALALLAGKGQT